MSGQITKLSWLRNGGLRVFVDGQALCVIDPADWGELCLTKGEELGEDKRCALLSCAQRFEARRSAAASLACQAYSAKGLERRLCQKGVSKQAAREAVERCKQLGYLEDERYAADLAQRLHETRCYGRRRIAQELREKGVEEQTARRAMDALPPDEEALLRCIEKKHRQVNWDDAQQRERAVRALLRYGFAYEHIAAAIGRAGREEWE